MTNKLLTKNFICICATCFFIILNYFYLIVTLPLYLIQHLDGPKSQAGLIVTMFFIAAIIIRPFTGKWIQQFGVKKVFITALILYFSATLLYFISTSVVSLLLLRLFHGIGFGMVTTSAGTIVANIVPEKRKGEGMGYYGLMMNLAMAIGPFLGLLAMQSWGVSSMFLISTLSVLLGTITGLLITLPKQINNHTKDTAPAKRKLNVDDLYERSALRISIVVAFFAIIYASIISFVSVYAEELRLTEIASYFFVVYAISLIISRPFTGRWFDRYGPNVIMYPAIICLAFGMGILAFANSAFLFLLSAVFIGLGWGTIFPSSQTIAVQLSPPARRGVATATFLTILDIGVGIGSLIFGFVGAIVGYSSLYLYGAILVLLGVAVYYLLHGRFVQSFMPKNTSYKV